MKLPSSLSRQLRNRKGSALLASIILVVVIAGLVGVYLDTVTKELRHSQQTYFMQSAMNYAEAGVEEAMRAYNNGEITSTYRKTFTESNFANNLGEDILVRVWAQFTSTSSGPDLKIRAEGRVSKGGVSATKQIEVDMGRKGMYANGLTADEDVTFKGQVEAFSYNSKNGSPDEDHFDNNGDKATVGSNDVVIDSTAISLGNSKILGFVATAGAQIDSNAKVEVRGHDSDPDLKIDPSRISYDFYAEFDPVTVPTYTSALTAWPTTKDADGNVIVGAPLQTTYLYLSNENGIKLDEGSLKIYGDVRIILADDFAMTGQDAIELDPDATLHIYAYGDVNVAGKGIINTDPNSDSTRVQILGMATEAEGQEIQIQGNGRFVGGVYAPHADLILGGGGDSGGFFGAAIANTIMMNGNFPFGYDEALDDFSLNQKMKLTTWREIVSAAERKTFDALMSAN